MNKWYTKTDTKKDLQGLVIEEETGRNVAVTYNPEDARLVAAAPELLDTLRAAKVVVAISHNSLEQEGEDAIVSILARLADAYKFIEKAIGMAEG